MGTSQLEHIIVPPEIWAWQLLSQVVCIICGSGAWLLACELVGCDNFCIGNNPQRVRVGMLLIPVGYLPCNQAKVRSILCSYEGQRLMGGAVCHPVHAVLPHSEVLETRDFHTSLIQTNGLIQLLPEMLHRAQVANRIWVDLARVNA